MHLGTYGQAYFAAESSEFEDGEPLLICASVSCTWLASLSLLHLTPTSAQPHDVHSDNVHSSSCHTGL